MICIFEVQGFGFRTYVRFVNATSIIIQKGSEWLDKCRSNGQMLTQKEKLTRLF